MPRSEISAMAKAIPPTAPKIETEAARRTREEKKQKQNDRKKAQKQRQAERRESEIAPAVLTSPTSTVVIPAIFSTAPTPVLHLLSHQTAVPTLPTLPTPTSQFTADAPHLSAVPLEAASAAVLPSVPLTPPLPQFVYNEFQRQLLDHEQDFIASNETDGTLREVLAFAFTARRHPNGIAHGKPVTITTLRQHVPSRGGVLDWDRNPLLAELGKCGDRASSRVGTCTSGWKPLLPETGMVVFGSSIRTTASIVPATPYDLTSPPGLVQHGAKKRMKSVSEINLYILQMRDHKSNFKQTWQSQNTQQKIAFLMNSSLDLESGGLCVVHWVKKVPDLWRRSVATPNGPQITNPTLTGLGGGRIQRKNHIFVQFWPRF
ncbi:hypothetical protein B0H19DRAFT_1284494 [Mycena capillaripes]|nr:hypothetical protein B0H19DRAFT_1284494 [Mycena capillaripes]